MLEVIFPFLSPFAQSLQTECCGCVQALTCLWLPLIKAIARMTSVQLQPVFTTIPAAFLTSNDVDIRYCSVSAQRVPRCALVRAGIGGSGILQEQSPRGVKQLAPRSPALASCREYGAVR